MPARSKLRKRWLTIHLYLGLILGLILATAGITGSLLVFYIELDELLNPELSFVADDQGAINYQAIYQQLLDSEPQRQGAWRLEIPEQTHRLIAARFYKPAETHDHGFAPLIVNINPYTCEIVSKRFWGQYLMTWLYDLHYTLLIDIQGKWIMAITGIMMLVSLLTGLYLWWPSKAKWLNALSFKRRSSPQRLNYDIHKIAGIYNYLVLVIIALTGIALEIPDYVNPLINQLSPITSMPKPLSAYGDDKRSISLDEAINHAQPLFPDSKLAWIETPVDKYGSIRINFRQSGEPSSRFPKTNVWIDQYSGDILAIYNPFSQTIGTQTIHWLHPLHSGEAFGLIGRILVCLSGFALLTLIVTGVVRWLDKRRARKLKTN